MAVRIRYVKLGESVHVTKQSYILPTGQVVTGVIEFSDVFRVKINEVDRDVTHFGTSADTLKDAKTALKAALTSLGVVFNTELRAKKSNEPEPSQAEYKTAEYKTAVKQDN